MHTALSGAATPYALPNETFIQVHIRADSFASLREQLQKALDDMGWAPQQVAQAAKLAELVQEAETGVAEARAAEAAAGPDITTEKPRRTRKAKEEAPAAPAADPTSSSPAPIADKSKSDEPAAGAGAGSTAATVTATSPSTSAATSSGLTHEKVKARAEEWMSEHPDGPAVAKKEIRGMLATFGVAKVAELPPESLADFVAELDGGI